ncbi:hypothetical protein GIY62_00665 [Burkholderia plantarii]|uniref:hypothetical protein n=1 Tax=Burkholderia plantarii TaxID=41899 RepID=UPI00272AAE5A|nr:hypothetical protein [Burkholderia plantarii]WLE59254.1 hypothetical protein GIY62_00665 [Burkholderia plantarii]
MTSTAFQDIGYQVTVDDGDVGYLGDKHITFTPRPVPAVAGIKPTPTGHAACAALVSQLRERFPTRATRPARPAMTPEEYWGRISLAGRGFR